ncbi:glycosyltransferase [Pelagicoccus sp. SDUM812003]|uniref:glycosyltransferase family 2 protein n=1 Tax=Pelagicoccus sp. SDUM812003 TaxID=3041267 RepID=UPI00280CA03F|nr:glycosyltransferase [Pelagicoccus sp. SDUM812003]MDQ8205632.1 glycosyltransferase [Pelagicoccus sp. SDUM812003]
MPANKPAISIVMSVYNSEKYLAESIESILHQTFTDFEFIIIDDGSADRSRSIIESYLAKDKRITLISRENKGLPYSLNEGIALAEGRYIARMDADDISLPNRIEKQIAFMDSHKEIGVCGTLAYLFQDNPTKRQVLRHPEDHDSLRVRLLFSVCFIHPTVIIRKKLLDELDYIYNVDFNNSQDYELWSRLADKTRFFNIQQPLIYYRVSPTSITANTNKERLTSRYPLISKVQKEQLAILGLDLNADESIMHFRLGLNTDMILLNKNASYVKSHLYRLIKANRKERQFDRIKLYNFLSKKYFIFTVLTFKNNYKNNILNLFSFMFIRGLIQISYEQVLNLLLITSLLSSSKHTTKDRESLNN